LLTGSIDGTTSGCTSNQRTDRRRRRYCHCAGDVLQIEEKAAAVGKRHEMRRLNIVILGTFWIRLGDVLQSSLFGGCYSDDLSRCDEFLVAIEENTATFASGASSQGSRRIGAGYRRSCSGSDEHGRLQEENATVGRRLLWSLSNSWVLAESGNVRCAVTSWVTERIAVRVTTREATGVTSILRLSINGC